MSHRILVLCLGLVLGCAGKPKGRVVVSDTQIEFLEPITFDTAAELSAGGRRTLDSIAQTLIGNPSIKVLAVEVHVADGDEAARRDLAQRRSQAIVDYLIGKQVAPERLRAAGLVASKAAADNTINFEVVERSAE